LTLQNNQQSIGERLKILRKSRYLTLKDIEAQTKITAATISNLENNLFKPSLEVLVKLANLYGESIDFIVNGTTGKAPSVANKVSSPESSDAPHIDSDGTTSLFAEPSQKDDLLSYYENAYELEKHFSEMMKNRYNILKNVVGNLLKIHKEKGSITLDEASINYIMNLMK